MDSKFGFQREKVEEPEWNQTNYSPAEVTEKAPLKSAQHIEFGDRPVRCTCPHCDRDVVTQVETSHNVWSFLLFFALFLCFSFISLCIYPFVSGLFKDSVHTCPRCWSLINKNRRFRLPVISREIITVRCGDCAIVLSKKYVFGFIAILSLVTTFSILRWYVRAVGLPDMQEGPTINNTWDDFYNECGARTSLGNPIHRNSVFDHEYFSKTINWTGRLNRVEEGFFQRNFVFLNMDPHQSPRPEVPDLALMYNARTLNDQVAEIEQGDLVQFRATLIALGARASPHVGVLWEIERLKAASELPDLFAVAANSRNAYGLLQKPPIAHFPGLARKVVEARQEFIQNRLNDTGGLGFYVGDELVGMPMHLQKDASRKGGDQIDDDNPQPTATAAA